jgi:predicted protein tyrosine phosphatase
MCKCQLLSVMGYHYPCMYPRWRSPTAETLFKDHPVHQARSAGTSDKARIKVNEKILNWADIIFVMERKHKELLKHRFPFVIAGKNLIVLGIEDNYRFGDAELITILKNALTDYLMQ